MNIDNKLEFTTYYWNSTFAAHEWMNVHGLIDPLLCEKTRLLIIWLSSLYYYADMSFPSIILDKMTCRSYWITFEWSIILDKVEMSEE